jgi:hypothetical protein
MKGDRIYYYDCGSFYVFNRAYHKATGATLLNYSCQVGIYPDKDIDIEFSSLTKDGVLTLKHGMPWDGPSGPTFDTKSTMRPSGLHDPIFKMFRLKLLDLKWFPRANDLLRETALEDGMWKWRANLWHSHMVQKGMMLAATDYKEEKELVAP